PNVVLNPLCLALRQTIAHRFVLYLHLQVPRNGPSTYRTCYLYHPVPQKQYQAANLPRFLPPSHHPCPLSHPFASSLHPAHPLLLPLQIDVPCSLAPIEVKTIPQYVCEGALSPSGLLIAP